MNETLLAQLIEDGRFPGKASQRTLIETHISWVILTDEYAFKLKKPMKYPFLDFSTLEKREHFCQRELELNQRLAPEMYLKVVPVMQDEKEIWIGNGKGKVIDYAVQMKKLDSSKQMHLMLKEDKVQPVHMVTIAKRLASFHQEATVIRQDFEPRIFREDFNDILNVRAFVAARIGWTYTDLMARMVEKSNAFVSQQLDLLKLRIKQGFTRDLHGDLHGRNIFLYPDPIIFDCIEFNDSFRQIDLLSEIAFFCMDLEAHGKRELSRIFLEHYLREMADEKELFHPALFEYYKCYRANVRAKVNALRAMQADECAEKEHWMNETVKYLNLMNGYTGF